MNRFKTFRSHFNRRWHRIQEQADHLESAVLDRATVFAKRTREGFMLGKKSASSWENSLERSIRAYPLLYAGGVLALLGAVMTSLLLGRKR